MAAVCRKSSLPRAGGIKTQTHTLAPDMAPARATASPYLAGCPVQRRTAQRPRCVDAPGSERRTAWATASGRRGRVRKESPPDGQRNRAGDLHAPEADDTPTNPGGQARFPSVRAP